MNRLAFIMISLGVGLAICFLPIIFIINPIVRQHSLLEEKLKIMTEIEAMSKKLPTINHKNKNKVMILQNKLRTDIHLESIEDEIIKHGLRIESVKPQVSSEGTEFHLMLKGEYQDLLRFFEMLSRQPNTMELIYISMNKDIMEIIFKSAET